MLEISLADNLHKDLDALRKTGDGAWRSVSPKPRGVSVPRQPQALRLVDAERGEPSQLATFSADIRCFIRMYILIGCAKT